MIYLIDGHNLIAKMPDIELDDPNDEVKLVLRLRSWASAQRSRQVIVIFDQGLPGGKQKQLSSSDITAVFAPTGKTADTLLINRINQVKNPRDYTVISSDQSILEAASQRRIATMRSEAFVKEMGVDKRLPSAASQPEAGAEADPTISEKDVAHWLELFGPEPETPKKQRRKTAVSPPPPPPPAPPAPEKKPPLPLAKQKRSTRKLEADEVDEWLRLFGSQPETPPPAPAPSSPATPPTQPKRTASKLDANDVEEWLRFFGDGQPKQKK